MAKIFIVIPCYNEEEVLPETSKRVREKMVSLTERGLISQGSRILFVDDGSKDKTWQLISELHQVDDIFSGVRLSRNRGHQNALLAGLMTAKDHADAVISMDADLQDDIDAIDGMIEEYHRGCDVVYGVRSSRTTDTAFKRITAEGFYKLTNRLGGELVFNHADYRLLSRRALEALSDYGEVNLFLRGIVPMLGYKTATVEYERGERFAGESKYPLKKMLTFAMDGISSLSSKPLKMITVSGLVSLFIFFAMLCVFIAGAVRGNPPQTLSIIAALIILFGGLILVALGLIGEYMGRIYTEVKNRPRYHISEELM
jgi:glycosyltransferase involved in cell wall biosynthesis